MTSVAWWSASSAVPGLVVDGFAVRILESGGRRAIRTRNRLGAETWRWLAPSLVGARPAVEERLGEAIGVVAREVARAPAAAMVVVRLRADSDRLVAFELEARRPTGKVMSRLLSRGDRRRGEVVSEAVLFVKRVGEFCGCCGSVDRDECRCPCICCHRSIDDCDCQLRVRGGVA